MLITGEVLAQFFAGAVQLLGAEFSIFVAYYIFMLQRADSDRQETAGEYNRVLQDFARGVATIADDVMLADIPLNVLRDEQQFEELVDSLIDSTDQQRGMYIKLLAEAPRRARRSLANASNFSMGGVALWLGLVASAVGSIAALLGILLGRPGDAYKLGDLLRLDLSRHSLTLICGVVVLLGTVVGVLGVLAALVLQQRRQGR